MNKQWKNVSSKNLCKICGKPDWCCESDKFYMCRRIGSIEKELTDKDGGSYWIYPKANEFSNNKYILNKPSVINLASSSVRNDVYTYFLSLLTLSELGFNNLNKIRGFPLKEIIKREYKSLPLKGRAKLMKKVVERFGEKVCYSIPGFYKKNDKYWSFAGSPGIIIPVRDIQRNIIGLKIRAYGTLGRYIWFSSRNKGGIAAPNSIHFPLFDKDSTNSWDTEQLRITEGELKADYATIITGVLTLSVPGVSSWRPILPLLKMLEVKKIKLAYDMDIYTNRFAITSWLRLCTELNNNYELEIETW